MRGICREVQGTREISSAVWDDDPGLSLVMTSTRDRRSSSNTSKAPLIAAEWASSPLHVAEEWAPMALYRWSLGWNSP